MTINDRDYVYVRKAVNDNRWYQVVDAGTNSFSAVNENGNFVISISNKDVIGVVSSADVFDMLKEA
ncbi:MAG: hypothetical protein K0U20_08695 [Proteobacteria bacterium]|nr:hypothetical protein [Pseudomonadota bacterium]